MKKLSITFIGLLIVVVTASFLVVSVKEYEKEMQPVNQVVAPEIGHTYECDDTNYMAGELLFPDYVHDGILMVIDAPYLNYWMEYYPAESDGDIAEILKGGTIEIAK